MAVQEEREEKGRKEGPKMKFNKMLITPIIIAIAADQILKALVENFLNGEVILIDNFFSLHLVHNTGVAWGMLDGRKIFILLASLLALWFVSYIQKTLDDHRTDLFFVFIYAGAIGNMIDRVFRGYVVDYLDFTIFGYDFPVFNLADMYLVLGSIGLFIFVIVNEKKEEKNEINS